MLVRELRLVVGQHDNHIHSEHRADLFEVAKSSPGPQVLRGNRVHGTNERIGFELLAHPFQQCDLFLFGQRRFLIRVSFRHENNADVHRQRQRRHARLLDGPFLVRVKKINNTRPLDCFAESFTRGFVSLNLSQFPETLIESELFGHRKGAFTGAVEEHEGVLARCSPHGAILLDEIGDATIPVQIKLLQVLQERTFSPVGSHEKKRFRGRVIAATNRALDQLRATGQFRDDFYYRLCSDVITVPPLRQRITEDGRELDDLVTHLVLRLTGETSPEAVSMVQAALDTGLGRNYPWPGNVRELEQAVRRILLTRQYTGDLKAVAPDLRSQLVAGVEHGTLDADAVLSGYCQLLYERHGTYEEVARRTNLDRRTVKAYLEKRPAVAGRG